MEKLILVIITVSIGFLSGCSSLNSGFDCPNKAGVMCKSLDQVNTMVDRGDIRGTSDESLTVCGKDSNCASEFQPYTTSPESYSPSPIRYSEKTQRIWVAPFEDTEGNYHQDNFIYTIIQPGHWSGYPVKSISQS